MFRSSRARRYIAVVALRAVRLSVCLLVGRSVGLLWFWFDWLSGWQVGWLLR